MRLMNTTFLGAIVLSMVLLVSGLATLPVEQATAVHTTIIANAGPQFVSSGATTIDGDGQLEIDCSEDFLLWDILFDMAIDDNTGAGTFDQIQIDDVVITTVIGAVTTPVVWITADAQDFRQYWLGTLGVGHSTAVPIPLASDDDIEFEINETANDITAGAIEAVAVVTGGGACTVTFEAEDL